jgi:hypothetical protein
VLGAVFAILSFLFYMISVDDEIAWFLYVSVLEDGIQ